MKILLFGKNGQVGWELQRSLAPLTSAQQLIALGSDSRQHCGDLADLEGIRRTVQTIRPDIIINAAAYTAVDQAEQEQQLARTMNTHAPAVLAEEAVRLDAWLIHYSTDYVFDGSGNQSRTETDVTDPINVYGMSKLAGEKCIIASNCRHIILRTSWVYSARGNNFIRTILGLAQERDRLNIVDDQIGAPTGAELIADVTAHITQSLRNWEAGTSSGVYHLATQGNISWYGLARFLITEAKDTGLALKLPVDQLYPIATVDYPLPAKRPLNSRLDTVKIQKTFNLFLPEWQIGVSRVLTELLEVSRV